jgi:hypothetical protein
MGDRTNRDLDAPQARPWLLGPVIPGQFVPDGGGISNQCGKYRMFAC